MAKNTSSRGDAGTGRGPSGKALPATIVIATKSVTLGLTAFAYYVIAFFAAVRVVPTIMAFVASGSGVTADMQLQTLIAAWIAPSLFLIALLFALVLVTFRAIWRGRRRVVADVSAWALGLEPAPTPAVGKVRRVRATTV